MTPMLVVEADSPEGRILGAIVAGPRPWACAVSLLLDEAERSGPDAADAALEGLRAAGYVCRWDLPANTVAPGPLVTLTPLGAVRMGCRAVPGQDDLDMILVETKTEHPDYLRWGFEGNMPDHYEMPRHGRLRSLDDPRMAGVRAGLSYEDRQREFLTDKETGKPIVFFAGPDGTGGVPIVRDKRIKPAPKKTRRMADAATDERRIA